MLLHGDSHLLRNHIGGAPVEIGIDFRSALLRKTAVSEKGDTEVICGRLTFNATVQGRLPHSAQSLEASSYALV
jgi:hypothetical protein